MCCKAAADVNKCSKPESKKKKNDPEDMCEVISLPTWIINSLYLTYSLQYSKMYVCLSLISSYLPTLANKHVFFFMMVGQK